MKKNYLLLVIPLLVLLASCEKAFVKQEANDKGDASAHIDNADVTVKKDLPTTPDAAVRDILLKLPREDKELVKNTPFDKLFKFHRTLGGGIRNDYDLFGNNDQLRWAACKADRIERKADGRPVYSLPSVCTPDEASMYIIELLWRELNKA